MSTLRLLSTDSEEDTSPGAGLPHGRVNRRRFLQMAATAFVTIATLPVESAQEHIEKTLLPGIEIDQNERMQKILGFGAAMTDSSAYNIWNSSHSDEIMQALFDPERGIGLSLLRVPIGGSDFVVNNTMYSYDDLPARAHRCQFRTFFHCSR